MITPTIDTPLVIAEGACHPLRFNFRLTVSHGLASRAYSDNALVAIRSHAGLAGYGESVPRTYVTGETIDSACDSLGRLTPSLAGRRFDTPRAVIDLLAEGGGTSEALTNPAAWCAFELALLDLAGKHWGLSLGDVLGLSRIPDPLVYSLVVPLLPIAAERAFLEKAARIGFSHVKVKVDATDPVGRIRRVRAIVGDGPELRADANATWNRDTAPGFMRDLAREGVVSVEQPLPAGDLDGSALLRSKEGPLVTLDESVWSASSLERIAAVGAADIVNIRISKCGGMIRSLKLIETAKRHGIGIQLGAQVGESSLLSAAGACLAAAEPSFRWREGCFGAYLLERGLSREELQFGPGGLVTPPSGHGLGIAVDPVLFGAAKTNYTE